MCKTSDHQVFLIGGFAESIYFSSCLRYSLTANEWDHMPEVNVARGFASSTLIGGYLFVFCGYTGTEYLRSVERIKIHDAVSEQIGEAWLLLPPT